MSSAEYLLVKDNYSLTFGAGRITTIVSAGFVAFLCLFDIFYAGSGFASLFEFVSRDYDPVNIFVAALYSGIALYLAFLFILATLLSKWLYKIIYLLVFIFAIFVEYGYSKALGRFTNFFDVIGAFSAQSEQRWYAFSAFFDFAAVVPCLVLIAVCFLVPNNGRRYSIGMLAVVMGSTALFYMLVTFTNPILFDRQFTTTSLGASFHTTTEYLISNPIVELKPKVRETVEIPVHPADHKPNNNIVFIFDESVRGDHLSLNGYERQTTPYLEQLAAKGLLLNWGIAVSGSTISHPSYDAMISGASPDMIVNLGLDGINSLPMLFQYAKAMNYRTYFFDGQMRRYWGGLPDDLKYIDEYVPTNDLGPGRIEDWERDNKVTDEDVSNANFKNWQIDRAIAKRVNGLFSGSTGNFIFIYKRGAHFPYEKNYPKSETFWTPIFRFKEHKEIPPADQLQAVMNSYDNAIRYNLDGFFKTLASDYADLPNNSVIVYTSDHGESLYIDGRAGHGGKMREEAMVPLFILGLKNREVDTRFKASHGNVFTALLDLMDYPEIFRKHPYQLSILKAKEADSPARFYNPPPGEKLPFD